jgi:hypothetical protein
VATYTWSPRCGREVDVLTPMQRAAFLAAVSEFVQDLRDHKRFRKGLRVKGLKGAAGIFDMTLGGRWTRHLRVLGAGPRGRGAHRVAPDRDACHLRRTMTQLLPSSRLAGVRDPCAIRARSRGQ